MKTFAAPLISLLFSIFFLNFSFGQDSITTQKGETLDSLKSELTLQESPNLTLLLKISSEEPRPDSIIKYANLVLDISIPDSLDLFSHDAYLQIGNARNYQGDLAGALENYIKSIEYAEKSNYSDGKAIAFIAIAGSYSQADDAQNAINYYNQAIPILRAGTDSLSLGLNLFNIGDEYLKIQTLDSAELFTQEAQQIFQNLDYQYGEAYCIGNLGMLDAERGQEASAERKINRAVETLEEYEDYYAISFYLDYMSNLYFEQGRQQRALTYSKRSLDLAEKHGLKDQISITNLSLSNIYEKLGNPSLALLSFKNHIAFRDSVNNIETVQQMANLRTDYEVSQKQTEVDLLEREATITSLQSKRQQLLLYGAVLLLVLLSLLAFVIYRRFRFEKNTKDIIQKEKDRSDELLLNILPAEIAEELKIHGKVKAHRFNSATVLFTDFKSFSTMAEQISPEKLVESIDFYFKEFDSITQKYKLEKIKTIGDSYMCAGGIPTETSRHPFDVVKAGIEMMEFTKSPKPDGILQFEMRIGIHTGPIVAGIVGVKKWQYDIWGDTVNIASRMESNSEEGKVNISGITYEIIKEEFECEYRGSIDIKNRGIWDMYFLRD